MGGRRSFSQVMDGGNVEMEFGRFVQCRAVEAEKSGKNKKNKRHEKHEHSYFLTIQFHSPSHPINQFLVSDGSTPSVTS